MSYPFRRALPAFLVGLLVIVSLTSPAMAQDIGDTLNAANENFFNDAWALLQVLMIPLGVGLVTLGLLRLVRANDQGDRFRTTGALMTIVGGIFMVSLPIFADTVLETFKIGTIVAGTDGFQTGASADPGGGGYLAELGRFIAIAASPLSAIMIALSFVVGIGLVMKGIFDLVNAANSEATPTRATYTSATLTIVCGAILTNMVSIMSVVSQTFGLDPLGTDAFLGASQTAAAAMTSYGGGGADVAGSVASLAQLIAAALLPIGLIAAFRGILILQRVSNGNPRNETNGVAFTHLIGGVAMANAMAVTCLVAKSFSTTSPPFC